MNDSVLPSPTDLVSRLIQFDTQNFGGGRSSGERETAEWIAEQVRAAGFEPHLLARDDAPDRTSVVVRVTGTNPELAAIIVHAHTDVVPVEAEQWSFDPFSGEVRDGFIHGRGAVDMLDTVGALLHTLLVWGATGARPRRDLIAVFVADEEDAGLWGAEWLVSEHPELFAGAGCAIGEAGGAGRLVPRLDGNGQVRLYTINCGERGSFHIRLTATGASGHGSRPTGQDAVAKLLRACARISSHQWELSLGGLVEAHVSSLAEAVGATVDLADEASRLTFFEALGEEVAGPLPWTIRPSSTVTMVNAGYKVNVIPGRATAEVDVRCPPGAEELVRATVAELVGEECEWEFTTESAPLSSEYRNSEWYAAMVALIRRHDPEAVVIPGCMGGGTDNKAFARLGIETFGFTPAPIDPDGLVGGGMHGVDEKVPVAQVEGGAVWLRDFLEQV